MIHLGVNIDHVATVRQARRDPEPDPIHAAVICELAGAHGITVHLRGDRRHIIDRDLRLLREVIKTKLNLERVSEPVPKHIVWGKRTPSEENQLAPFLRWLAWVSDSSVSKIAKDIGYTNNAFYVNCRATGASAKFREAVFIWTQDLFPGCPIDLRQIMEIAKLTGEDLDRWSSIVDQIRDHMEKA